MLKSKIKTLKVGRNIGALVGFLLFLVFGTIPAFHFGGYSALMLMSNLSTGLVEPSVFSRLLVAAGIFLGLACTAMLSIVLGSLTGTALAFITELPSRLFHDRLGSTTR